ncbi:TonB-dependent receptor plug domain-containing protein [Aurantiacibacter suaedae]|uniref:TonB-dependent receptor plug domain-containing protein n=1 Tax=Aurantiacibacter suaedae TaxID=2545755 RepID=UPI001F4F57FA|nr:TonB-dependent receptor [Aurantiacibacter suaedae]
MREGYTVVNREVICGASVLALGLVPYGASAQASDPVSIVVTATGFEQDRTDSGQAVSVIDASTLEQRQARSVASALQQVPSVRVNRNGSRGSVTGVSLRGAATGQTLVLLDGVRINDPSSTGGAVDFGNLLLGSIRRIEVMRGANAIAYGSEAIGGVIDLSTSDPAAPNGLSLRAMAEGGSAETVQGIADLGYRDGDLRLDAGITGLSTAGISSAAERFGASERDGLRNWTAHARAQVPLSDAVAVDLRGYAIDSKLDYDNFFGTPADSADVSAFGQETLYGGLEAKSFGGKLTSRLALTYLTNRRDYRSAPDAPVNFGYRGETLRFEYKGKLALGGIGHAVFGYGHDAPEYRFFGFGSDETHSAETDSVFGMMTLKPVQRLSLTGGVRYDEHSAFGGITTFGANANYGLGDGLTRLRVAFGEGFRTPSLYQLYDSYSGNGALAPERSTSFDAGVDRSFADGRGRVSLSAFTRLTRDQIDYDMTTYRYTNIARTRSRGVEAELAFAPGDGLDLALAYSLLDARNLSSGADEARLPRRPVHAVNLSLDKTWRMGLSLGTTLRIASDSTDPVAPNGSIDGYSLLDLRARWQVVEQYDIFLRLENALDATYETAYGYGTEPRSVFAGIQLRY